MNEKDKLHLSFASLLLGLFLVERGSSDLRKTDWKRCWATMFKRPGSV